MILKDNKERNNATKLLSNLSEDQHRKLKRMLDN